MAGDLQTLARSLIDAGKLQEAAHVLETILQVNPAAVHTRWTLARVYILLKEQRFRALARDHLEILVDLPGVPPAVLRPALQELVWRCYSAIGPGDRVAPLFERMREHFSEADARTLEQSLAASQAYRTSDDPRRPRSSVPLAKEEIADADHALRTFIFNAFRAQAADRDLTGPYFTFGSCFAGNVAGAMRAAGVDIESFWVGEEVNTTFSNLNLLKVILGEPIEHQAYYAGVLAGLDTAALRASLTRAENVIYTLGLAPAFFSTDGAYIPHDIKSLRGLLKRDDVAYRFSSVEENLGQLRMMAELLRRHTRVKTVFLTVSPVPLATSLASTAAAVDDSESKAILRSAAGAMCREAPEFFTYFPSFEAFRWLPCFQESAAFGDDDGSLRHTNGALVDQVVEIFMAATRQPRGAAADVLQAGAR